MQSTFTQHISFFSPTKIPSCPREIIINNLVIRIKICKADSNQTIIMSDINNFMDKNTIVLFFNQMGLRNINV